MSDLEREHVLPVPKKTNDFWCIPCNLKVNKRNVRRHFCDEYIHVLNWDVVKNWVVAKDSGFLKKGQPERMMLQAAFGVESDHRDDAGVVIEEPVHDTRRDAGVVSVEPVHDTHRDEEVSHDGLALRARTECHLPRIALGRKEVVLEGGQRTMAVERQQFELVDKRTLIHCEGKRRR